MFPLEIIDVIPVGKASLMEQLTHYLLTQRRIHSKHEIFDMRLDGRQQFDYRTWQVTRDIVNQCNDASGVALPEPVEAMHARKAKEAAEKRADKLAEDELEEARKRVLREEKRAEKLKASALYDEAVRSKRSNLSRDEQRIRRRNQHKDSLTEFLANCCEEQTGSHVETKRFKEKYEAFCGRSISSQHLTGFMAELGVSATQILDNGYRPRVFKNICIN